MRHTRCALYVDRLCNSPTSRQLIAFHNTIFDRKRLSALLLLMLLLLLLLLLWIFFLIPSQGKDASGETSHGILGISIGPAVAADDCWRWFHCEHHLRQRAHEMTLTNFAAG